MVKERLLFTFFLIVFGAVIIKLFYIQILNPSIQFGNDYLKTNKLQAERGKIYDRNNQPLAVNQIRYLLYAEPNHIKNKSETIHKLDETLHLGEATLGAAIDNDKLWVPIKSYLKPQEKDSISKLGIKGLGFTDQYQRYYPEASLAAHLLGFVGKNSDGENVGYFGIEGYYDKDLTGLSGVVKSERDVLGNPILIGTQEKIDSENGRDFLLTIDKTAQEIVKRKLKDGIEKYQANDGCVIVAQPYTMEILALSCIPDFDAEKYYSFNEEDFKNSAISEVYEPGSTFKPLVVASALEEKSIKPDEVFDESGPVTIGEYSIRTWNNQYEGTVNVTRILERSSNVGMVRIGEKMGNEKLYKRIHDLGFGEETGIDLQGEAAPLLREKNNWYPIDYATATFGQGIAVTPIQMVRAFASIINGGNLLKPYVTYATVSNGVEKKREPEVVRKIFSERTSQIMKQMLYSTVENGEFKWAKPKGYKMGGKTGTAQIPIAGHYDATKTVASFIGFAPLDKPQFLALVILHEPKTSPWGAETAAPLFFDIAKELLVYYNIPPDN